MNRKEYKKNAMTESQLKRVYNYQVHQRDLKKNFKQRFVNIDNGEQGGTPWRCFHTKVNKSFYFDSFSGPSDKFLLNKLPKPITLHQYKIQYINMTFCKTYCLCFFNPIEKMNHYDAVSEMYFEKKLPINVFGSTSRITEKMRRTHMYENFIWGLILLNLLSRKTLTWKITV